MSIVKHDTGKAEEEAHLFVMVHGLWGSPNHMLTIEKAVKNSLAALSSERIITIKPSSFRFWKTYDGIQRCAERVIADLLYEIETLKQTNKVKVVKISIIGYSLGGLISRYVVGLLYEMGFFEEVEPVFFCTFATPHVGVHFFKKNMFDRFANFIGKYLFGYTGLQLFNADSAALLSEMAEQELRYFKGLALFKRRILLANIKNDRSVAFYTSYITEYSPFDLLDSVNINYLKNLPPSKIGRATVWPKFIDLRRSHKVSSPEEYSGNVQEETSILRSNKFIRYTILLTAAVILVPFYIPLILFVSLYVSAYSVVKVKVLLAPNVAQHWLEVKEAVYRGGSVDAKHAKQGETRRKQRQHLARHESFKGDTSNFTENAMENMLFAEQRFVNGEPNVIEEEQNGVSDGPSELTSAENSTTETLVTEVSDGSDSESEENSQPNKSIFAAFMRRKHNLDIHSEENDAAMTKYLSSLHDHDYSEFPLFEEHTKLSLPESQKRIIANLNKLEWIKIAVYHDLFNAHDGIVARRGEASNPKGTCTIYLWASILRNHLKEEKQLFIAN